MTVYDYLDPSQHAHYERVPDLNSPEINSADPLALFEAVEQRKREMLVKQAHMKHIEQRMRNCYFYHGAHNFTHKCRKYIEEFIQTKDECLGFKEDKRIYDYLPNAHNHLDTPPGHVDRREKLQEIKGQNPETSSSKAEHH